MKAKIHEFEAYLLQNKYISQLTIHTYSKDICNNADLVDKLPVHPSKFDETFAFLFDDAGKSANVTNRTITSLRHYNEFLNATLQKYPLQKPGLTDAHVKRMLQQPDMSSFKGLRDKAILAVLCGSGLCVSELIGLNMEDVDIEKGCIYLKGKSKHCSRRTVTLQPEHMLTLCIYIFRCPSREEGQPLFFRKCTGKRLSRSWIWKIVQENAQQAEIPFNVTPSDLRKYFAYSLHEKGETIESIQNVLGINSYRDMQEYFTDYYAKLRSS